MFDTNTRGVLVVGFLFGASRRGVFSSRLFLLQHLTTSLFGFLHHLTTSPYICSMYSSTTSTTLPSLALHLANLPAFEYSSDRETPISNPPSSIFSASSINSGLSSTSISPLSLITSTPVNQSVKVCHRKESNPSLQRASTLPLANAPAQTVSRIPATPHSLLPEGFQKCSFVDSLVDTGALLIETIWQNQTLPVMNSKILPLRVFIQETIRRSRTSFSTLQLALYYLLRIKSAVIDFETKNPEWFNGPCNFGKIASKHPIACGRRMFLAAVIVASKYLQDRNYSNRAWAKISGLPVKEINANEFVFLNVAKYDLYVGETLYKRWSGVLLNHVMATVSVTTAAATVHGLVTPPLTPVISPVQPSGALPSPNNLRIALAHRFCEAIRQLSPQLTEAELTSLQVLGFQSPQQKPMSPPPSRNGPIPNGSNQRQCTAPSFPLNGLFQKVCRLPSFEPSAPSPCSSTSDSASDSDSWSPRSTVSSASSNDSTNISPPPQSNVRRCYLKNLGCTIAAKTQSFTPACLQKRCASPLSIIASCNDRKRNPIPMTDSPMSLDAIPATPRPRPESNHTSAVDEEQDWSSAAGTIDPKLLQLNPSALTAVKGLCSLSQRATVFQEPPSPAITVPGSKRTFGKSYSMGTVQYDSAKRRRGAIPDQTLARMM